MNAKMKNLKIDYFMDKLDYTQEFVESVTVTTFKKNDVWQGVCIHIIIHDPNDDSVKVMVSQGEDAIEAFEKGEWQEL